MSKGAKIQRRPGTRFLAELHASASVCFFGDRLIIASPDAPPRILKP